MHFADINTLLDICLHIVNLGKCESEFEMDLNSMQVNKHLNIQPIELYQEDIFNTVQPLPVVHCSAGIGRTGCLTAILNGIRQLRQSMAYSLSTMLDESMCSAATQRAELQTDIMQQMLSNDTDSSFTKNTLILIENVLNSVKLSKNEADNEQAAKEKEQQSTTEEKDEENESAITKQISISQLPKIPEIFVDILGIVCNLRLQRGGMVQNSEQYELIHRAICLYLKRTFALKRF